MHPPFTVLILSRLCVLSALLAPSVATAASDEDCRQFRQECEEAKSAGYRDVGICNVERRECGERPPEAEHGVASTTSRSLATLPGGRPDPECSVGP
jgi:hypothetical protein